MVASDPGIPPFPMLTVHLCQAAKAARLPLLERYFLMSKGGVNTLQSADIGFALIESS